MAKDNNDYCSSKDGKPLLHLDENTKPLDAIHYHKIIARSFIGCGVVGIDRLNRKMLLLAKNLQAPEKNIRTFARQVSQRAPCKLQEH
jgi:hypothetical protein